MIVYRVIRDGETVGYRVEAPDRPMAFIPNDQTDPRFRRAKKYIDDGEATLVDDTDETPLPDEDNDAEEWIKKNRPRLKAMYQKVQQLEARLEALEAT